MAEYDWKSRGRRSPIATGLLMFVMCLVSIALSHFSGDITAIWLGNGVVFAIMLSRNQKLWPAHLLAVAAGNTAAGVLCHFPVSLTLISVWANTAEIFLLLAFTHRFYEHASGRFRISGLRFTLLVVGVVALVTVSTIPLLYYFYPCDILSVLPNWYLSDVLGMLLMVTLVGLMRRRGFNAAFAPGRRAGTWACLVFVLVATGIVFSQSSVPIFFLLTSGLVFVVFQRGVSIAILAFILHAILATSLTMHGHGPVGLIHDASMMTKVIFLQSYLLVTFATVYPVGRVLHKQERVEQLNELLANNSRDVISRTTLEGEIVYCSPSVKAVLGFVPEEMLGVSSMHFVHPEDADRLAALHQRFRDGLTSAVFPYRARMKSGGYLHMEARIRMLREPVSNVPYELISTSRDISERVGAEARLQAAYAGMERLASIDALTGLANRRVFNETMEREWRRAMREQTPLALLMFDVDFFKRYNDSLGHQAGDECLRVIASCLAEVVQRPGDVAARYGGEEFAALLPVTDEAGAAHIARRIMETLDSRAVPHPDSPIYGSLTLSVGVAAMVPAGGTDPELLVEAADRALYQAKNSGRNRLEIADCTTPRRP